jgi:hypothetical protein
MGRRSDGETEDDELESCMDTAGAAAIVSHRYLPAYQHWCFTS